ncbi:hypothetical protein F5H01DRAFT_328755 [Linnemannia elongata]|nr:hypothetical protein F5H01DRAFT_328755 [Linnemannia elongata]
MEVLCCMNTVSTLALPLLLLHILFFLLSLVHAPLFLSPRPVPCILFICQLGNSNILNVSHLHLLLLLFSYPSCILFSRAHLHFDN